METELGMFNAFKLLPIPNTFYPCADFAFRCFPHVVNISVTHGLKALTEVSDPELGTSSASSNPQQSQPTVDTNAQIDSDPCSSEFADGSEEADLLAEILSTTPLDLTAEDNTALQADKDYARALTEDPIKRAHQLVSACRASSLRREAFEAAVIEAKASGLLPQDLPSSSQLLRDVDTRWSSVLFMIDRVLEFNPVSNHIYLLH